MNSFPTELVHSGDSTLEIKHVLILNEYSWLELGYPGLSMRIDP